MHLKDLAVFCTAYMKHVGEVRGRMVDRLRERAVSATPMRKCSPPSCHVPRFSGRRLRIDHPLVGWLGPVKSLHLCSESEFLLRLCNTVGLRLWINGSVSLAQFSTATNSPSHLLLRLLRWFSYRKMATQSVPDSTKFTATIVSPA